MQLVTDCIILYDTMKDKKIGIPEVIEKFGVPPEKVIEVQALIGDSTDNVPGVPGIGVKTAAQLIGEYGDLEAVARGRDQAGNAGDADRQRRQARIASCSSSTTGGLSANADLAMHEPDRAGSPSKGDGVLT
jgi:DNA polymerase-1